MSAEEKKMDEVKEDVKNEESEETTEVPIDQQEDEDKEPIAPTTNVAIESVHGNVTVDGKINLIANSNLKDEKFQIMMNRIGKVCIIMSVILFLINSGVVWIFIHGLVWLCIFYWHWN